MNTAQETTPSAAAGQDSEWMTYAEAAALIGCSTKTIQRRVKAEELVPHLRHGSRHWWLKSEDVARLLVAV